MAAHESRRRYPRIEVEGPLKLLDVSQAEWVDVSNVSAGGFQAVSRARPRQGDTHTFKVAVGHVLYSLMATAVYVRPAHATEHFSWLVGWRASDDARTEEAMSALIAFATDVDRLLANDRNNAVAVKGTPQE